MSPTVQSTAIRPTWAEESESMIWVDRRREQTFRHLLAEYGSALRRVAGTYEADSSLREDLFQEICLAIWKALPSFRGEASARTFVFRIAHNRGLTHGWREGRRPGELEEPESVADVAPSPEAEAAGAQRRARLLAAVRQLPVGSRQVLALRLEGLSFREIAEVTGHSENSVTVRASRARKALKSILETSEP